MAQQASPARAIMRLPAVKQQTGLSRSGIYLRVRRGEFPAPIKLGVRASGWIADEVADWVNARVAATREAA